MYNCSSEPEVIIEVCVRKCSFFMVDPVGHSLDRKSGDATALANMAYQVGVVKPSERLIGPDGLPLISSKAPPQPSAQPIPGREPNFTDEDTPPSRPSSYHVRILN
ncbi:hypothetical protein GGI12_005675, partial [Dipsacomyces acuminosporus]